MKNITNTKFGKLTAVEFTRKSSRGNVWLCKCNCGNAIEVPIASLIYGWRKSCGCLPFGPKPENLTGKIYGRLTVIKFYDRVATKAKDHKTEPRWLCKCSCGNTKIVKARTLNHDKTKSCGCLQKEVASKNGKARIKPETFANRFFKIYKDSASRRGLIWDLKFKDFKVLITRNCYMCGKEPEPKALCRAKYYDKQVKFNGIDRVDNSKAYSKNNCKPCCSLCNHIKGKLSKSDIINHIEEILTYIRAQR